MEALTLGKAPTSLAPRLSTTSLSTDNLEQALKGLPSPEMTEKDIGLSRLTDLGSGCKTSVSTCKQDNNHI